MVPAADLVQRVTDRLEEVWLAPMMVPSMLNSITACDLPIAEICPARSAVESFWLVTSVANFTTRNGLPFSSSTGL